MVKAGLWRKSTHSGNGGSACVEVKPGATIGVRDTKARAYGQLSVTPGAFAALVALARRS